MTLLELIVVLALMGMILTIVAPAFITPRTTVDSGLTGVIATARRAAIVRAEPVTIAVDPDGAWHIDGDATPTAPPIAAGRLASPVGQLRVRVSPIGTCVPDRPVAGKGTAWNALDCRLEGRAADTSPR
jgi:type II secretory pathway pseudopilin PulG